MADKQGPQQECNMTVKPKNLADAIEDLEKGNGDFQSRLKAEYHKLEETLADLRPHIEDLSGKVGEEARKAKRKVEAKVEENPWAAIGIVGLIFFILGFLFASKRRD
jgi:ElaB/YqjD/DUF883 family membrane-anchored ribosome-binding protein